MAARRGLPDQSAHRKAGLGQGLGHGRPDEAAGSGHQHSVAAAHPALAAPRTLRGPWKIAPGPAYNMAAALSLGRACRSRNRAQFRSDDGQSPRLRRACGLDLSPDRPRRLLDGGGARRRRAPALELAQGDRGDSRLATRRTAWLRRSARCCGRTIPATFSIVLVDDQSTDGTADVARHAAEEVSAADRLTVIVRRGAARGLDRQAVGDEAGHRPGRGGRARLICCSPTPTLSMSPTRCLAWSRRRRATNSPLPPGW